jgi:hypothetical protein
MLEFLNENPGMLFPIMGFFAAAIMYAISQK